MPTCVAQHALDGEVGLAGVGRAEHGGDAAPARGAGGMRSMGPDHVISSSIFRSFARFGTGHERISSESLTRAIRISFRLRSSIRFHCVVIGLATSVGDARTSTSHLAVELSGADVPRRNGGRTNQGCVNYSASVPYKMLGFRGLALTLARSARTIAANGRDLRALRRPPGSTTPPPTHSPPASATQSGRVRTYRCRAPE